MVGIYSADAVLPVAGAPIGNGAVAVDGGVIVDVGPVTEVVGRHPGATRRHWGGVMTPGLVNAHTHLQYTSFDAVGSQLYEDYTAWSVRFVEEYDAQGDHQDWVASATAGATQMIANGITAVADIVTDYEARDVLYDLGLAGVAYLELIGTGPDDWDGGVGERLRSAVLAGPTTAATTVGISPHAPYSIDERALTAMADLARELGVRLHVHVGESDGEDDFYRHGKGSQAERLLQVVNRPLPVLERGGTGLGTAAFARSLGLLGPTCHIAHGVYLGPEGRAIMAAEGTIVALCPRSNRIVGIASPPVAEYLREGVPFAVGTDSLASSPSVDLLADVAELRRLALADGYTEGDLDARLLRAATITGAEALGLGSMLGSIEVGKRADLAVFDPELGYTDDPTEAIVARGEGSCVATITDGVLRHDARG